MNTRALACAAVVVALLAPQRAAGADETRELLRPRGNAERTGCEGIGRARAAGAETSLVVRTAIALGYNPCQVIRCALAGRCPSDGAPDLEPVIRGAAAAGVTADVVARCATEACSDPAAVAALLAVVLFEPDYCYFAPAPPAPLTSRPQGRDRDTPPPQVSPYRF